MSLRELRLGYGLSQQEVALIVGIPLRTYVRYENENGYGDPLKREIIINKLMENCEVTETRGLLSVETIKSVVSDVFKKDYKDDVKFCYLFGSYAKGYAKETSDVDLCVSTTLTGFKFVGLLNSISEALHKKVDLIRLDSLSNNLELLNEIMEDGIKIYG